MQQEVKVTKVKCAVTRVASVYLEVSSPPTSWLFTELCHGVCHVHVVRFFFFYSNADTVSKQQQHNIICLTLESYKHKCEQVKSRPTSAAPTFCFTFQKAYSSASSSSYCPSESEVCWLHRVDCI